jgi:hypothetical protein
MTESPNLALVQQVVYNVTLGMNTIDNDVTAAALTKAICIELLEAGVSLLPAKRHRPPAPFEIGLLLFPSGRVWRCLAPSGDQWIACWQLSDYAPGTPGAGRRPRRRSSGQADPVLEATSESLLLERVDRVLAQLEEARHANERLLRVVVESASSRRRPWVVRVLGVSFHFSPETSHDGEINIGTARASALAGGRSRLGNLVSRTFGAGE